MSVNWFAGGRCYDVGYDGDRMLMHISIDQWQSPEKFEKALAEAMESARVRLVARHKEMQADG